MKGFSLFSLPDIAQDSSVLNFPVLSLSFSVDYEETLVAKYQLRMQQINSEKPSTVKAESPEDAKISQLRQVVGDITTREAKHWLSSNNWDIEQAVNAYFATSNSMTVQIEFVMPSGPSFTHTFSKSDVLWSCLQVVYDKLRSERKFSIKKSQGGREFTYEELSSTRFETFGVSYLKFWVEF